MANGRAVVEQSMAMSGRPGAGKTMLLVAQKTAAKYSRDGWIVLESSDTERFWSRLSEDLEERGRLPGATSEAQRVERILTRVRPLTAGVRLCFWLERQQERRPAVPWPSALLRLLYLLLGESPEARIVLRAVDRRGRATVEMSFNEEIRSSFGRTDGAVFVYDWHAEHGERETTDGTYRNVDYLERLADGIMRYREANGLPLADERVPIPLAVCIPKIDEPQLCRLLWRKRLLTVSRQNGRDLPRVTSARDAYELLVDEVTRARIAARFARVACFPLTTVGFYVDEEGRFDWRDSCNVMQTQEGYFVRDDHLHPYNVLEPVLWLRRQARRAA